MRALLGLAFLVCLVNPALAWEQAMIGAEISARKLLMMPTE